MSPCSVSNSCPPGFLRVAIMGEPAEWSERVGQEEDEMSMGKRRWYLTESVAMLDCGIDIILELSALEIGEAKRQIQIRARVRGTGSQSGRAHS